MKIRQMEISDKVKLEATYRVNGHSINTWFEFIQVQPTFKSNNETRISWT